MCFLITCKYTIRFEISTQVAPDSYKYPLHYACYLSAFSYFLHIPEHTDPLNSSIVPLWSSNQITK